MFRCVGGAIIERRFNCETLLLNPFNYKFLSLFYITNLMTEKRKIDLGNGRTLTIREVKNTGDDYISRVASEHKTKKPQHWFFSWMNRSSTRKSAKGGKKHTFRKKANKRKTKKSHRK